MIEPLLILAFSVIILAKSSDIAVESSINLARFFRISEMAIGFIFLSVATSMPELVVSVIAALENQVGISVGNVLGSNIANICLVLGVSLLIGTIKVKKKEMRELVKILLITSILPLIMLLDYMRDFMGVILLLIFLAYIYFILKREVRSTTPRQSNRRKPSRARWFFHSAYCL